MQGDIALVGQTKNWDDGNKGARTLYGQGSPSDSVRASLLPSSQFFVCPTSAISPCIPVPTLVSVPRFHLAVELKVAERESEDNSSKSPSPTVEAPTTPDKLPMFQSAGVVTICTAVLAMTPSGAM